MRASTFYVNYKAKTRHLWIFGQRADSSTKSRSTDYVARVLWRVIHYQFLDSHHTSAEWNFIYLCIGTPTARALVHRTAISKVPGSIPGHIRYCLGFLYAIVVSDFYHTNTFVMYFRIRARHVMLSIIYLIKHKHF